MMAKQRAKKAKRTYFKPKVGDWAEFAFHPGPRNNRLIRWWVFIRAEVHCGFLVTRMGEPNVWFAMRHQLRPIPRRAAR